MRPSCLAPAVFVLLALLPAEVPPAWAGGDPPPPIGVRRYRQGDAVVVDGLLPGKLLDWAAPRIVGGGRRVLLLVSGAGQDLEGNLLLELDPEGGPLVELNRNLAVETNGLVAMDLDGDEVDELVVGEPGGLHLFGPLDGSSSLRRVSSLAGVAGLDLRSRPPESGSGLREGAPGLHSARLGALDRFRPDGEGGLEHFVVAKLPVRAERRLGGLRLQSPEATVLRRVGEAPLYAVGPEAVGRTRLRTMLYYPAADLPVEAWSRLPEAEVVQWHRYVTLNDAPALVVTVNSADKLGLFERQRLRVFGLLADRTRAGGAPLLESRTASRRWQRVWPAIADVDGDGGDDLVLIQTDGLGGMKLVAEAFLGDRAGGFDPAPRRTAVDRAVELTLFGHDFTSDGAPDLLLVGGGELAVLAGDPGSRKRFLEKQPARRVIFDDPGEGETEVELDERGVVVRDRGVAMEDALELVDLDGDGVVEVLYVEGRRGHRDWEGGRVRIVRWD